MNISFWTPCEFFFVEKTQGMKNEIVAKLFMGKSLDYCKVILTVNFLSKALALATDVSLDSSVAH